MLKLSWHGSQAAFERSAEAITRGLVETSVPWKKTQAHYLPVHILLPIDFIPYKRELIWKAPTANANANDAPGAGTALAHIYFTDVMDSETYRSVVRAELVEWFACLRDSGCTDWLIVWDCAKARDKKAKQAVLEKIKADFSKLVETDSSQAKQPVLVKCVRECVLRSLDAYIVQSELWLASLKEKCYSNDWQFEAYVDAQLRLSQVYSELGLHDQTLAQYDELQALLSVLIDANHKKTVTEQAGWLCKLCDAAPECCPSVVQYCVDGLRITANATLLDMRMLLLACQIRSLLSQYGQKVKQADAAGVTTLASHYCATILQYAVATVNTADEECRTKQVCLSAAQRSCWRLLLCLDVMHLCSTLCDPAHVANASTHICLLWHALCQALYSLGEQCAFISSPADERAKVEGEQLAAQLVGWIRELSSDKQEQQSPSNRVRCILGSRVQFGHHMQKFHESAMAVLKHFKWKRHARLLGKQLADYLVHADRVDGALPLYAKLLTSLWLHADIGLYTNTLLEVIEHFRGQPELYQPELMRYYMHLAVAATDDNDRHKYTQCMMEAFSAPNEHEDKHSESSQTEHRSLAETVPCLSACVFDVDSVDGMSGQRQVHALQTLSLTCRLTNQLARSLNVRQCRFVWYSLASGITLSSIYARYSQPSMSVVHQAGGAARLVCAGSHIPAHPSLTPRLSFEATKSPAQNLDNCLVFSCDERELAPGPNQLTLTAVVPDGAAVDFYPGRFDVLIGRTSLLCATECLKPIGHLQLKCVSREPELTLEPVNDTLLGGVVQQLRVRISPGTQPLTEHSRLTLSSVDQAVCPVQFEMDDSWSSSLSLDVGQLEQTQRHEQLINVVVCLSGVQASDAFTAQIAVNWLSLSWTLNVTVTPALYVTCRTLMLEDTAIVCCTARCTPQAPLLTVANAKLLCTTDAQRVATPLNNSQPQPIGHWSDVNFVWRLPARPKTASGEQQVIEYRLELPYSQPPADALPAHRALVYRDNIQLINETAEYELCCQMTSSGLLCRVGNASQLVVSLRALNVGSRTETLIAQLGLNKAHWTINTNEQMVQVKESGLAQASFELTPLVAGYLPFPTLTLHRSSGASVRCYCRTAGKQVHVLHAKTHAANTVN